MRLRDTTSTKSVPSKITRKLPLQPSEQSGQTREQDEQLLRASILRGRQLQRTSGQHADPAQPPGSHAHDQPLQVCRRFRRGWCGPRRRLSPSTPRSWKGSISSTMNSCTVATPRPGRTTGRAYPADGGGSSREHEPGHPRSRI